MNKIIKWDLLIISSLLIWWFFPIIAKVIYNDLNFLYTLAFITFFSIFFFLFWLFKNKEWKYFKKNKQWLNLIIWIFILWVVFYSILFYGISKTSAINSSIFWLSEVLFSYLLFWIIFTKKKSSPNEILWTIMILIWWLVALSQWNIETNIWDFYIILACLFAPIWHFFTRKTIDYFSTNFIMLLRSIISVIFLFIISYIFYPAPSFENISNTIHLLLFSWIILFWLSKLFRINSYKYIWVSRASSFLPLYPIFTIIYSIIFIWVYPSINQALSLIPIWIWILVFYNKINLKKIINYE